MKGELKWRVFHLYSSGMSLSELRDFLHIEQEELEADEMTTASLMNTYGSHRKARQSRVMTFEGFSNYLESIDCIVFNPNHCGVYQDMDHPLSHYFIFSSHNTYLTGNQLFGQSHVDAYKSALLKGCRCVEIDCWNGPDMEPVVYHGHTFTSKILFKDVITTIEQYAFEASPYPIIISLENHCSKEQQDVMAHYLISILGDKLLREPLDDVTPGQLPSPSMLQYKILIKNETLKWEDKEADKDEDEEGKEDKAAHSSKSFSPRREKVKVGISKQLSDLVVYTASVKFENFPHAKQNQSYFENTSMEESKAHQLALNSGRL